MSKFLFNSLISKRTSKMLQLVHMRIWFIFCTEQKEYFAKLWTEKIPYYHLSTCWCLLGQSCKIAWSKTIKGHIPRGWDNPWRVRWTRLSILLQGHPIISLVPFSIWQFLLADFLPPVVIHNLKIILDHQKKLVSLGLAD